MCNNPYLDPVNVIEYAKFALILLICSQNIEQKQTRHDGMTESWTIENSITHPHFSMLGV